MPVRPVVRFACCFPVVLFLDRSRWADFLMILIGYRATRKETFGQGVKIDESFPDLISDMRCV
ncbi:hypothetical protein BEQ56_07345 [Anaerolineaceae bacterium oral taxon 439]|nr:hypothetical protein BEQ56_07345 [Anaerolineaceae bacterium oral taxon 439]